MMYRKFPDRPDNARYQTIREIHIFTDARGDVMLSNELLKRKSLKNPPAVIDVRTGFEFKAGHIPGAIHAPTWKILLKIARLPADRDAEMVVTCEHGPRAQLAKGLLGALGYRNVDLLEGHMAGWLRAGHPVEK
jgi:hydroxyacylglutathione hydrolase